MKPSPAAIYTLCTQIRALAARGLDSDDVAVVIVARDLLARAWSVQDIARQLRCREDRLARLLLEAT